MIVFPLLDYRR